MSPLHPARQTPEDIDATTLLGICTSLKPASDREGRSATRSLLSYTLNALSAVYPSVSLLDLRDHPPPLFDGRMPHEYGDPALEFTWSCVNRAGALLLAIPAYWSGVSGVFKNFVDVLCGPAYDLEEEAATVLTEKPVGLLIVGADEASASAGAEQAHSVMLSTGAKLVGQPVVVANLRSMPTEADGLARELIGLGAALARHAYLAQERRNDR